MSIGQRLRWLEKRVARLEPELVPKLRDCGDCDSWRGWGCDNERDDELMTELIGAGFACWNKGTRG